MRERVTVVTLSVCLSVTFQFGKGAIFRVKNIHQYNLGDDLNPLNVALFFNRSSFGEKASGTSGITAVVYMGTVQSLNGLVRELLACELLALGTLYQSYHSL